MAVPTKEDDIDELWVHMRKDISTPPAKFKSKRSADQKQVDHYANIVGLAPVTECLFRSSSRSSSWPQRTNTLLFYLGVNLVIAIVFSSTNLWKVGRIKSALLEVISRH